MGNLDPVAGWHLSLYREAGEAGGSFRGLSRRGSGGLWVPESEPDPDRSLSEAVRRARAKVRRYCAANGLNRLGTLTYRGEGCFDPRQLRGDLGRFFRRVREGLGGEPFPYLWVPEWHPGGHGLHVQFGVGRYVRKRLIDEAWGLGFTHIKLLGGLPVGSGVRGEARAVAGYISKYVSKDMDRSGGLNRYDLAQGFQPKVEGLVAPTVGEVIDVASERMGDRPAYVWRSIDQEGWRGPSAVWLQWR